MQLRQTSGWTGGLRARLHFDSRPLRVPEGFAKISLSVENLAGPEGRLRRKRGVRLTPTPRSALFLYPLVRNFA